MEYLFQVLYLEAAKSIPVVSYAGNIIPGIIQRKQRAIKD